MMLLPDSPIARASLLGIVLAAATLGLIMLAMMSSFSHSCEVCVTFRGRTACREAAGKTEEEAMRTAVDNACAFLAGGMTQTVECTNTVPTSRSCSEQ